ncbi:MAG: M55 family metallopeptidase [bacterium]|nr:M55 family metallopeptidase [bacterium]
MKIFILCDLEGAAGVVDFQNQTYDNTRFNEQAKYLATLELNALIDGALEGGATDIIVLDGHGSGGLNIEHVHREARVMYGRPLTPAWDLGIDFDAQFLYGHHAMDNTPNGVLCHSWSSRTIANCWLNGELIGEIGLNVARAGEAGVPTVFVSGDRAAIVEAQHYVPNIEGVVVKEGLSRTAALTLSPAKARDLIQESAHRVMSRIGEFTPFTIAPPYTFITEYRHSDSAESKAARPDVERVDTHTVKITGDTLAEIAQKR